MTLLQNTLGSDGIQYWM